MSLSVSHPSSFSLKEKVSPEATDEVLMVALRPSSDCSAVTFSRPGEGILFPLPLRVRVAREAGRVRGAVGVGRDIIAAQPPHPSPVGRHLLPRWGEGYLIV